eukprot:3155399-Ditylum_brightwellii.AAC.1
MAAILLPLAVLWVIVTMMKIFGKEHDWLSFLLSFLKMVFQRMMIVQMWLQVDERCSMNFV